MATKLQLACLCVVFAALAGLSNAAEYFVGKGGDDSHNGLSRETAFETIQRGVDALEAGDTLTILPGEYFESVSRDGLGSSDADTTIRAGIPGTVILRGDVPAPEFRPVEGFRFVYAAEFPRPAQAVNEVDTLSILESEPNVSDLEFLPGAFHHDEDSNRLYISTTDLQPPDQHTYTVSVSDGRAGIYLVNPERVVLEGLTATGFHNAVALPRQRGGHMSSDVIPHGFYLWRSTNSTVRNCRAYFNAGGISVLSSGGNIIEDSVAYANNSKHGGSAGNIAVFGLEDDIIRGCRTYMGQRHGIRMYGAGESPAGVIQDSLSWGNRGADFQIKAGGLAQEQSVVERCLAPMGSITASPVSNSLVNRRDVVDRNNIVLTAEEGLDPNAEFADPANFDYRLQSTSRFRKAGEDGADRGPFPYEPNIFYLSPQGDDSADGLSVATAWRSLGRGMEALRPGDTLYLESGSYEAAGALTVAASPDAPVSLRGRGREPAVVTGAFPVRQSRSVRFERLAFAGQASVADSRDIRFENCRFAGQGVSLTARSVQGLRVTHSEFTGFERSALELADANGDVFLQGNVFDNRNGVAVRTQQANGVLYSDFNGYRNAGRAWRAGDAQLGLQDLRQHGHEAYARTVAAEYTGGGGAPKLANPRAFAAQGPFGKSLGIHHPQPTEDGRLQMAGPFVHSVTDTTANIEWWTSGPTDYLIEWGESPDAMTSEALEAHRFGTFSMTGLKPTTTYRFRVTLDTPLDSSNSEGVRRVAEDSVEISFTTAAEPHEPKVYHVAKDGDDANDGLTRETAWRTVSHAADRVRPGDTVLIGEGTYSETVRVRVTGERDRPITFRSAPGEKVTFDGNGRVLGCAFYVTEKSHLRFDGFYFVDFMHGSPDMPWSDRAGGHNGSFVVYRSNDIQITRCFHDSRGPGYGPGIIHARHSRDVAVRNSVIIGSMGGGLSFAGCPGFRIENNVFLRNLIAHVSEAVNEPHQTFYMENNIFTDSIASKVGGFLFDIGKVESFVERDNCYYLRIPSEERRMFRFYEPEPAYGRSARSYRIADEFDEPSVVQERKHMNLAEFQERFNPDSGSVAMDPLFQASLDMGRTDDEGNPIYLGDRLSGAVRDFPDLFTTHPDLIERGIGLQPEAFEDFHFAEEGDDR